MARLPVLLICRLARSRLVLVPDHRLQVLHDLLKRDGIKVSRKHVATLMKRMGIDVLYRKPKTTKTDPLVLCKSFYNFLVIDFRIF